MADRKYSTFATVGQREYRAADAADSNSGVRGPHIDRNIGWNTTRTQVDVKVEIMGINPPVEVIVRKEGKISSPKIATISAGATKTSISFDASEFADKRDYVFTITIIDPKSSQRIAGPIEVSFNTGVAPAATINGITAQQIDNTNQVKVHITGTLIAKTRELCIRLGNLGIRNITVPPHCQSFYQDPLIPLNYNYHFVDLNLAPGMYQAYASLDGGTQSKSDDFAYDAPYLNVNSNYNPTTNKIDVILETNRINSVKFFAHSNLGSGDIWLYETTIRVYLRVFGPVVPVSVNPEPLVIPGFRDGTLGLWTTRTALSIHV